MKVSHVEGVASYYVLESCGATRKGGDEALTEERAGWVWSRENMTLLRKQQALQGADALEISGRHYRVHRQRKGRLDPARSAKCILQIIGRCAVRRHVDLRSEQRFHATSRY